MTKKILALLFILSAAANLPASECMIVDQNEMIITNDNNATYALLIGMDKNNSLTAENLALLTKTQSVESILEILITQRKDLQSKVDAEKLNRAATSMFNRVGKKWAGLVAAVPSSYAIGTVLLDTIIHPMSAKEWQKYNNTPRELRTRIETITKIIDANTKSSYQKKVSLEPNWTTSQLENGVMYVSLALGTLIALNYAQQLYQYYTHIRNYEKEITRIDAIIETINALRVA